MTELHRFTAGELARAIANGDTTSRAALDHLLARIERHNPALNAVIALDADRARLRADAADRALAAGERWGPLHGVPMTVKDTFEVLGFRTVAGHPLMVDYDSQRNATAVQRLINAGAIILGKTNTPWMAEDIQTYNDVFGTTNNPWNTSRTPGGSSGGPAAALAAGLTPLELGSDLAGSIRIPANWCGVYGHKPSYGVIPIRGHIPGRPGTQANPDLAVAGPLARHPDDLALALEILAGPDTPDDEAWAVHLPEPGPKKLTDYRIACLFDHSFAPVAETSGEVFDQLTATLENAGASVTPLGDLPHGLEPIYTIFESLLNALISNTLPNRVYKKVKFAAFLARLFGRGDTGTQGAFFKDAAASHHGWARIDEARHKLRHEWHRFFADYDAVLLPVTCVNAIAHDQSPNRYKRRIQVNGRSQPYTHLFRWVAPATAAGLPATAAPAGIDADNLPVGVQIVADYGRDKTAIALAGHLAQCAGGFAAPPGFT